MERKLCFQLECTSHWPIELWQNGIDDFEVRYGLAVKRDLDYDKACTELGSAIMHRQACAGLLDNREKGEE